MAYRTSRVEPTRRTAEAGIALDMVRQFADRYAFMRELVQNGIDAGATRIEVRIERDVDGVIVTSVEDDGCGMTRAIIEGPLLTLFSSSKEGDSSKIGKYGIGFVSVFAIEPEVVEVLTRRGNEAWLVRLFGDHSFELSEAARDAVGTTVSLVVRKDDNNNNNNNSNNNNKPEQQSSCDSFEVHVRSALEALHRWCRHARVPIRASILDMGDPASARSVDINEPMTTPGVVSVSLSKGDEHFVVSVGPQKHSPEEPTPLSTFGGFYNRGLTLYESTEIEERLEDVRFKVDSPRLSHTLSRDNVKRDREHRRVLDQVATLVRRDLHREVLARLEQAAKPAISSGGAWSKEQEDEYKALLDASCARAFAFADSKGITLPLLEPIADRWTIALADVKPGPAGDVLVGEASTKLTRALARQGHPVVRNVAQLTLLRKFVRKAGVLDAAQSLCFASAISQEHVQPNDEVLARALVDVLGRAGKKVAQARFAIFEGVGKTEAVRVVEGLEDEAVTSVRRDGKTFPPQYVRMSPWGRSSTIFLNVEDAGVRLARRRAKTDVAIAAHLMCRAILVMDGPLSAKIVDRLLEAAGDS